MQPCTWVAPASTPASALATAQSPSSWKWTPTVALVAATTSRTMSAGFVGQAAAVGVAQHEHLGAGLFGRVQHGEGELGVALVAVEEVLGVEEDALALADEPGDRVADHGDALVERRPQRLGHVVVPRLADDAHHVGAGAGQVLQRRVVVGVAAGPPRGAEGDERRGLQLQLARLAARSKNSSSLGLAPGQPPSM